MVARWDGRVTESDARTRFRGACAAVVAVLPRRVRTVLAPSMIGFAVVNGFTFVVDLLLLSLLVDGIGLPLWAGITVAYGTAFAMGFVLNRWLNFEPERPLGTQIGRYVAVVAVNYGVIVLGVTHGLAAAGVPYQLARLVAGACEAVVMYAAMRWFVFARCAARM
jgi:putative flippase GtrA